MIIIVFICCIFGLINGQDLKDSLIASFPFNKDYGVTDATCKNRPYTIFGNPTITNDGPPGVSDYSLEFDGDDYVVFPGDTNPLVIPPSYTISFWIKPKDPVNKYFCILEFETAYSYGFLIWNWLDGYLTNRFVVNTISTTEFNAPFQSGVWQFVYVSYDSKTGRFVMVNNGVTKDINIGANKDVPTAGMKLIFGNRLIYYAITANSTFQGNLACFNVFKEQVDINAIKGLCGINAGMPLPSNPASITFVTRECNKYPMTNSLGRTASETTLDCASSCFMDNACCFSKFVEGDNVCYHANYNSNASMNLPINVSSGICLIPEN